ncbi:hypothetical protein PCE1_003316 [Barthelona sp. PCE]
MNAPLADGTLLSSSTHTPTLRDYRELASYCHALAVRCTNLEVVSRDMQEIIKDQNKQLLSLQNWISKLHCQVNFSNSAPPIMTKVEGPSETDAVHLHEELTEKEPHFLELERGNYEVNESDDVLLSEMNTAVDPLENEKPKKSPLKSVDIPMFEEQSDIVSPIQSPRQPLSVFQIDDDAVWLQQDEKRKKNEELIELDDSAFFETMYEPDTIDAKYLKQMGRDTLLGKDKLRWQ